MVAPEISAIRRLPSAGVMVLAVAMVLYVLLGAFSVHGRGNDQGNLSYDARHYEDMTKRWLSTGVFSYYGREPDAKIAWGYPTFLAPFYYFADQVDPDEPGGPYVAISIGQLAVGVLGLLATWIFAKAALGVRVAGAAVVVLAITQGVSGQSGLLLLHTLSTALFSGFMALWAVSLLRRKTWIAVCAGVAFSASLLTRPSMLLPGLVLIALGISTALRPDRRLRLAAVGGTAILVAPWIVRNWILRGTLTFTEGRDDPVLAGVDPWFRTLGAEYRLYGPSYERFHQLKDSGIHVPSKGEYAWNVVLDGIKHRPIPMLSWFTVGKLQEYLYASGRATGSFEAFAGVWTSLFNSAVVLGAFMAPWYRDLRPTVLALGVGMAQMLLVVPEARYMYDLSPLMAICAGALMVAAIDGARAMRMAAGAERSATVED